VPVALSSPISPVEDRQTIGSMPARPAREGLLARFSGFVITDRLGTYGIRSRRSWRWPPVGWPWPAETRSSRCDAGPPTRARRNRRPSWRYGAIRSPGCMYLLPTSGPSAGYRAKSPVMNWIARSALIRPTKSPAHRAAPTTAAMTGQRSPIDAQTSEVPELKPLIANVNMVGWVLTADALHTVRESARHLAEDLGAYYVLMLKGNQPPERCRHRTARPLAALPCCRFLPGVNARDSTTDLAELLVPLQIPTINDRWLITRSCSRHSKKV
jgi:hypothetical protein